MAKKSSRWSKPPKWRDTKEEVEKHRRPPEDFKMSMHDISALLQYILRVGEGDEKLPFKVVNNFVRYTFWAITDVLTAGGEVHIDGFGTFSYIEMSPLANSVYPNGYRYIKYKMDDGMRERLNVTFQPCIDLGFDAVQVMQQLRMERREGTKRVNAWYEQHPEARNPKPTDRPAPTTTNDDPDDKITFD